MPVVFGSKPPATHTPAPAQQAPAASTPQAQHANTPAASAYQGPRPTINSARPSEGFAAPPPSENTGGTGKRYDEFGPLSAGSYRYIACVGDIARLQNGSIVEWKVLAQVIDRNGDASLDFEEAGRPIGWNQLAGPSASDKLRAFHMRTLVAAYAAGGWTWDENPTTGWPGWLELAGKDSNGNPIKEPPMDLFFVEQCADGVVVPVCLEIRINVDAGYEKNPKTVSVKRLLDSAGRPVQAPMPRRVPQWLAQQHGWIGEAISLGGSPHVKLDFRQIPLGHAGLSTYKGLQ